MALHLLHPVFYLPIFKYSTAGNSDPARVGITKNCLNISQHIPAETA